MNKPILTKTAIIGISALGLAGCGGSSPAASTSRAAQMSPEQQLATALTGMTADNGAIIESATVGLMCSGTNYDTVSVEINEAGAGYGCKIVNNIGGQYDLDGQRQLPVSDWRNPGVFTAAVGKLQMSDGNEFTVLIRIDGDGNISWSGQDSAYPQELP